ncbi:hypothetical protein ACLOJK_036361, partial [Asimina triloba]
CCSASSACLLGFHRSVLGFVAEEVTMVSDASKKKAAQKKAAAAAKRGGKSAAATSSKAAASYSLNGSGGAAEKLSNDVDALQLSDRTCTGVLSSHPLSRDIHVSYSVPNGQQLIYGFRLTRGS